MKKTNNFMGFQSLLIAFSMYSKIPVKQIPWEKRPLSFALCFFPLVGVVIGFFLFGWMKLSLFLGFGDTLFAVVALLISAMVSGGIHLDGFCDTCDALSSQQSRERKLEILKDSHTGAFAIICCTLFLLFHFACFNEAYPLLQNETNMLTISIIPVLVRTLSGLFATILPNASGSGLLATFTNAIDGGRARLILFLEVIFVSGVFLMIDLWSGFFVLMGAVVTSCYYIGMSKKKFGGITGDLAGFFLELCQVITLFAWILSQKMEVFL